MANRSPRDPYDHIRSEPDSPAKNAFIINPSADDLAVSPRGIYIGTGGNLFVRMHGGANNINVPGANITFEGVVAGTILPIRVDKVWLHANTTASGLVGLY